MTRPRKVQLDISARVPNIGRTVRVWPVGGLTTTGRNTEKADFYTYATIADVVQARKPEVGALYVVILIEQVGARPSYTDMIDRGGYYLIGHYTSAAERRALLQGERIDDGKQE